MFSWEKGRGRSTGEGVGDRGRGEKGAESNSLLVPAKIGICQTGACPLL